MNLSSLLYTSRSALAPDAAESAVKQIVAAAIDYNAGAALTGALLFTGTHFAQVLEGECAEIEQLIERISRDPRHGDLQIIRLGAIASRRFGGWRLVYFGPSQFVSQHITRLRDSTSPDDQQRAAEWLTELLSEFAANPALETG